MRLRRHPTLLPPPARTGRLRPQRPRRRMARSSRRGRGATSRQKGTPSGRRAGCGEPTEIARRRTHRRPRQKRVAQTGPRKVGCSPGAASQKSLPNQQKSGLGMGKRGVGFSQEATSLQKRTKAILSSWAGFGQGGASLQTKTAARTSSGAGFNPGGVRLHKKMAARAISGAGCCHGRESLRPKSLRRRKTRRPAGPRGGSSCRGWVTRVPPLQRRPGGHPTVGEKASRGASDALAAARVPGGGRRRVFRFVQDQDYSTNFLCVN
mmetsp:Transcript_33336/g.85469  ORF Transcript_33336/g.85469 Transcript_33336/m.85469 type:complete len:265 (+) Transcript_33336:555-1349(+)